MGILLACLFFALTRAEAIERFKAVSIIKAEGFVEVLPDCPPAVRRAHQVPVAAFAAELCNLLYRTTCERPRRFAQPALYVHLGEETNGVTNVVVRVRERPDGTVYTRVYLPDPAAADADAFRTVVAQAFFRSVKGAEKGEAEVRQILRDSDPGLRAASEQAALRAWRDEGVYSEGRGDEDYLRLLRTVLLPGRVLPVEVETFAARLYLYPEHFDAPFFTGGGEADLKAAAAALAEGRLDRERAFRRCLSFAEAVEAARFDPRVRVAAQRKAAQLAALGGGRGERMKEAVSAYLLFLLDLARGESETEELLAKLAVAETRLKEVEAR